MVVDVIEKIIGNYIDGHWVNSFFGEFSERRNPYNEKDVVGRITLSRKEDVYKAIMAVKKAAESWGKISMAVRGELLRTTADMIEERLDEITVVFSRELGKSIDDAREELASGVAILHSSVGGTFFPKKNPQNADEISPSISFPVADPLWEMASALLHGKPIIFKPSMEASVTAALIMDCFAEAEFPPGVLNMVCGYGAVIDPVLSQYYDVTIISSVSNQWEQ